MGIIRPYDPYDIRSLGCDDCKWIWVQLMPRTLVRLRDESDETFWEIIKKHKLAAVNDCSGSKKPFYMVRKYAGSRYISRVVLPREIASIKPPCNHDKIRHFEVEVTFGQRGVWYPARILKRIEWTEKTDAHFYVQMKHPNHPDQMVKTRVSPNAIRSAQCDECKWQSVPKIAEQFKLGDKVLIVKDPENCLKSSPLKCKTCGGPLVEDFFTRKRSWLRWRWTNDKRLRCKRCHQTVECEKTASKGTPGTVTWWLDKEQKWQVRLDRKPGKPGFYKFHPESLILEHDNKDDEKTSW